METLIEITLIACFLHSFQVYSYIDGDNSVSGYGEAELLHVETTYGGRYLVVGPGSGGKLFAVILAPKGAGIFYPVSARRASTKERSTYRAWKAGKQK